ncbi:jerky protein homolog [Pseudophryne corroboree]|uniref:jerky protein homolog n=1 Tax=Pseudophryne corroboree TaxID=495146 RepID=UPI0030814F5D
MASADSSSDSSAAMPSKNSDGTGIKRKHKSISVQAKVEILQKLDRGVSVKKLCDTYGLGSSTVYDIKKHREKILQFFAESQSKKQMSIRKTMKSGKSTELDRVLLEWFRQRRSDGVDLSGIMVQEQAKLYHTALKLDYECDYSEGWLHRFKTRHGISMRKVCGEKRSANHEAADDYVDEFAKLVADENLTPQQVYNADETALYWRCTPRKTLSMEDEEAPTGVKQSKDRVTVLGCSNAAGTHRCKPLVIGKSKCPRAFKGVKVYPVIYRANKNGWITTELMLEWFAKYFVAEARAHCTSVGLPEDCKILLILDNCSAHPRAELLRKYNVFTAYLPPNCTSLIQPQDQGILRSMKAKYRTLFMKRILDVVNSGKPIESFIKDFNMKDVLWFVASAWENVNSLTLKNGWHKLWPAMVFENAPDEDPSIAFTGFRVANDDECVLELLEYAKTCTATAANNLSSRLNEENLAEWMEVDVETPVVRHCTDSEIIDMVLNPAKITESDDGDSEDENVIEIPTGIDKLIEMTSELIKGLEQRNFVTEQELMHFHLMKEKLYRERSKLMKQPRLDVMFKKLCKNVPKSSTCSLASPIPPSSRSGPCSPDILDATVPPEILLQDQADD